MTREEAIQIFREDKEFYHANKEKILKLIQLNDAKEYKNKRYGFKAYLKRGILKTAYLLFFYKLMFEIQIVILCLE